MYIITALLCSSYKIYVYYIILKFNFVSFDHSILFLPQIHLILHQTTFFVDQGMFPLFTHLSANPITAYVILSIMWQYTFTHMITL